MIENSKGKFHLWIPTIILLLNIVFTIFLIEELIDASEPNAGIFGMLTPLTSIISFLYIKHVIRKLNFYLKILQLLNLFFISFPILLLIYGVFIMISY